MSSDSKICEDLDECAENPFVCLHGRCLNTKGFFNKFLVTLIKKLDIAKIVNFFINSNVYFFLLKQVLTFVNANEGFRTHQMEDTALMTMNVLIMSSPVEKMVDV